MDARNKETIMAGYQQTIIIGNVGRDPEMRYLDNGAAVCDFSVAVTESWNDKQTNEKREKTNWYKVTTWRGLAEVCNKYVHKGMQIMVSGTSEVSAYMGQDGQPRASLDLTARDVQFLGSRGGSSGDNNSSYDDDEPSYERGGGGRPQNDSDIPF